MILKLSKKNIREEMQQIILGRDRVENYFEHFQLECLLLWIIVLVCWFCSLFKVTYSLHYNNC